MSKRKKKFRCPLCGAIMPVERLRRFYPIEIFIVHGLGRGRGFSFERVSDEALVLKVIDKVAALYENLYQLIPVRLEVVPFFELPVEGWDIVGEA